uniref:Putative ubiquitin conjugating enzyme protein n=1 Tax=Ixodes ricinus TaxID=34613 RepID=V5IK34_IXORI
MAEHQSALLLRKQLNELKKNPVEGFSAGLIDDNDIYKWEVLIIGPPDTLYEGGFFKAHLYFPKEYPPPSSTRRPQLQRLPIKNGRERNLIPLQFAPAYHRSLLPLAPHAFQKLLTLFPKVKVARVWSVHGPF